MVYKAPLLLVLTCSFTFWCSAANAAPVIGSADPQKAALIQIGEMSMPMSMPAQEAPSTSSPPMQMPMQMETPPAAGSTAMPMSMPMPAPAKPIAAEKPQQPGYTLPQLEKLALKNNPTLVQARSHIAGERGAAKQAGLFPNPDLGYAGDLLGVNNAGLGEFEGGMLSQEVVLGGKLKYSRLKYLARASAAEQQAVAQQYRVLNDVRIFYYHALAAVERLSLQRELLKTAKDRWLTTHEMLNQGQANQADVHGANADLEKHKAETVMAENEVMMSWQQLTTLIGIDATYTSLDGTLEYSPPEVTWDNLWQRLVQDSPELGEAKYKLKSDELTVEREKRQLVPNVVLCGGAGYDQIDKSFAARAALNLTNIPVFNRNQGTIQQAQADLERQHAQVKLVELDLRRRLSHEYWRFKSAAQFVKSYHDVILPESRAKYEVVLRSYIDTRLDWPDVLAAQKDYVSARLEYIDYLLACRESGIELEGFLLTGGLIPPPGVTPPGHIDATPQPR